MGFARQNRIDHFTRMRLIVWKNDKNALYKKCRYEDWTFLRTLWVNLSYYNVKAIISLNLETRSAIVEIVDTLQLRVVNYGKVYMYVYQKLGLLNHLPWTALKIISIPRLLQILALLQLRLYFLGLLGLKTLRKYYLDSIKQAKDFHFLVSNGKPPQKSSII